MTGRGGERNKSEVLNSFSSHKEIEKNQVGEKGK